MKRPKRTKQTQSTYRNIRIYLCEYLCASLTFGSTKPNEEQTHSKQQCVVLRAAKREREHERSGVQWGGEEVPVAGRDRYIVCVQTFQRPFPHSPCLIASSAFICLFCFLCARTRSRGATAHKRMRTVSLQLVAPFMRYKCFDLLFSVDSSRAFYVYLHTRE